MRVECPQCRARYNVDEKKLPAGGAKIRCPKCQGTIVARPSDATGAVPLPAPDVPGVPLPMPDVGGVPLPVPELGGVPLPPRVEPPAPFAAESSLEAEPAAFDRDPSPFDTGSFDRDPSPFDTGSFDAEPAPLHPSASPFDAPSEPFASPALAAAPHPASDPFAAPRPLDPFGDAAGDATPSFDPFMAGAFAAPAGASRAPDPAPSPFDAAPSPFDPAPDAFDPSPSPFDPSPSPFDAAPSPLDSSPGSFELSPPDGVAPAADPHRPAPLLGALGPEDTAELEALFDDGSAPLRQQSSPRAAGPAAQPAGPDLHVRRRSGKVFGPFPEAEVARMLRDQELSGTEEISTDGETWGPLAGVPALAAAAPSVAREPLPGAAPAAPVLGRKKEAIAEAAAARPRRRWIVPAIGGGVALALLAAGLVFGLSPKGASTLRRLRGELGPNRPGAALLVQARGRLAEGGYEPSLAALDLAEKAVRLEAGDLEAKAVQVQAAALLERLHGGGAEPLGRAKVHLQELVREAKEDPETLKAQVAAAAVPGGQGAGTASDAEAALERLASTKADPEAEYLLGIAAAARRDWARASAHLAKVPAAGPGSARALHALGLVAAGQGDAPAAKQRFEEALARDPKHAASALEIASLAADRGDVAAAERAATALLAEDVRSRLGPRERARARLLRATALGRTLGADPEAALAAAEKELEQAVADDPAHLPARVAAARFALRRGAPDRALAALGSMAAAAPELHARVLVAAGRAFDASQVLDGALAKTPQDARLVHVKGLAAAANGKRGDAENAWAAATALDAGYAEPRVSLALSRLASGDAAAAASEIGAAAKQAPNDPEVLAAQGEVALVRGDAAAARLSFERALAADPASASAHQGLARIALAARDDAAAEKLLARALRLDPRSAAAQLALGELRWRRGDLPGAKEAFTAAVSLDSKAAQPRTRLGAVELDAGQVDAAISHLLVATNLDLANAEARQWYGRALLARGESPAALEQLKKAVDLQPALAANHLWLAGAQERSGNLVEAVESYQTAAAKDPRLPEPHERLGQLFATQRRWAEAAAEYEKAAALAPREPRLAIALADAKKELGRGAEAVRIYRAVLQSSPGEVGLHYKIARALHESSGAREALPWYERAAAAEPKNPMPHYYLGFAFKDRGQRERAASEFRAYLAARPDADDRKDIEREIEDLALP